MSYDFTASASKAWVGVMASKRVEGEKQGASSVEKAVVFFTQPKEADHAASAKALVDSCNSADVSAEHHAVGLAEWQASIRNLRTEGRIGDNSNVVIQMHGAMETTTGGSAKEHHLADGINTLAFIRTLREPLEKGGAPCSATIYLAACEAGDNSLRASLQELHNQLGVGVCVLLSGGKSVSEMENENALQAICEAFVQARRSNSPLPAPDRIFALIGSFRGDCITLIEANRAYPLILHAPQGRTEFGCAPLLDEIHQIGSSGVWSGRERDEGGARGDVRSEQGASRKARVSGDPGAVKQLEFNLREFGAGAESGRFAELQSERVMIRMASRSHLSKLQPFLESDPAALSVENEWSSRSDVVLSMFCNAAGDKDDLRRPGKLEYIWKLLESEAEHFHGQGEAERMDQLRSIRNLAPEGFRELLKKGFLFDAREGVSPAGAIRSVGLALAESTDVKSLKSLLRLNRRWLKALNTPEINDSHRLVLEMLEVAAGTSNAEMTKTIADLAAPSRRLFSARAEWIGQQYPRACAYLQRNDFFSQD